MADLIVKSFTVSVMHDEISNGPAIRLTAFTSLKPPEGVYAILPMHTDGELALTPTQIGQIAAMFQHGFDTLIELINGRVTAPGIMVMPPAGSKPS